MLWLFVLAADLVQVDSNRHLRRHFAERRHVPQVPHTDHYTATQDRDTRHQAVSGGGDATRASSLFQVLERRQPRPLRRRVSLPHHVP